MAKNGYEVLKGNRLMDFKLVISKLADNEIVFVIKTVRLGIFNFRAFLYGAMLLTNSDKAKELRSAILDIKIDEEPKLEILMAIDDSSIGYHKENK